jgi:heme exporter protein C
MAATSPTLAAAAPPRPSGRRQDTIFRGLLAATAIVFLITIHRIVLAPVEASMGVVQKIFYFHVPAAYSMYVGAGACFLGSAVYLYSGKRFWDAFARAGAEVAVAMGVIVMVTGPLWAAKAWGVYWTWDPRLTTSMLSVMLYVAYVVLRAFSGDGDAERRFAAALGVLGAANLPIIHYSVQKWGGNHPKVISNGGGGLHDPVMVQALLLGILTFTLLTAVLLWVRVRIDLAASRLSELEQEALELGVEED